MSTIMEFLRIEDLIPRLIAYLNSLNYLFHGQAYLSRKVHIIGLNELTGFITSQVLAYGMKTI